MQHRDNRPVALLPRVLVRRCTGSPPTPAYTHPTHESLRQKVYHLASSLMRNWFARTARASF